MNCKNDVDEIVAIINCLYERKKDSYEDTLQRFTCDISEDYLVERAKYIRNEIELNNTLKDAFRKLAYVCSDKKCETCPVKKYCNKYIKDVRAKATHNKMQMVDLFCGAGGLSLGFTQEGLL